MIGLDEQTFNALLNYLTNRPYKEVHQLIEVIQNTATKIQVQEEKEAEDE